jgi:hypothetical protein
MAITAQIVSVIKTGRIATERHSATHETQLIFEKEQQFSRIRHG